MSLTAKQVKLALVDDHNLFRKGLIKLINMKNENNIYSILFEAESVEDLKQKLVPGNPPDILLMDIAMPKQEDGFEAVKWVRQQFPDIDILIITMHNDELLLVKMVRLGVKGYLSKNIEVEDMHTALEQINQKGYYYPDALTPILVQALNKDGTFKEEDDNDTKLPAENPAIKDLSKNEIEFLKLSASDQTYQQIADIMKLSPKTIDGYRDALFKKLKAANRVGLALFAVKHGLVKL